LSHLFYASTPCLAEAAEDKDNKENEKEQFNKEEKEFARGGLRQLQAILKE